MAKSSECKHCTMLFADSMSASMRANHSRWCEKNPKRNEYKKTNNGSQLRTPEAVQKRKEAIKKAHADGKYNECHARKKGRKWGNHSAETKKLIQDKALASTHRRLRRKQLDYNGVLLDSTWEYELAKRLDDLEIKWIRPEPIPWIDEAGITHNYFPDFYLPDYNVFLDPKNSQASAVQKKKLEQLLTQYSNIVILETLEHCKNYSIG